MIDFTGVSTDAEPVKSSCIVRVRTTYWKDRRGLHTKKSVTFLRRQCVGYNVLEEDAVDIDVESVLNRIVNLYDCRDGVYSAAVCNQYRDWETGHIEDYDYELRPLIPSHKLPPPTEPFEEPFDLEAEVEDMNRRLGGWK